MKQDIVINKAYNHVKCQQEMIKAMYHSPEFIPDVTNRILTTDFSDNKLEGFFKAIVEVHSSKLPMTPANIVSKYESTQYPMLDQSDLELFIDVPEDNIHVLIELLKKESIITKSKKLLVENMANLDIANPIQVFENINQAFNSYTDELLIDSRSNTEKIDEFEEYVLGEDEDAEGRIPTPYPTLNKYLQGGFQGGELITIGGRTGKGKALDISTPILTTDGWKTMLGIEVGDRVYDLNGQETLVIFVSELQHNKKCYELTFSNKDKIVADAEHLWVASSYLDRKKNQTKIYTTEEIYQAQMIKRDTYFSLPKPNTLHLGIRYDRPIYVSNIRPVETRTVKCIQVDNKDHIYLAGKSLTPTHNTVVATNIMATACENGKSVMYISLEMSEQELLKRLVACTGNVMMSQISPQKFRKSTIKDTIKQTLHKIKTQWKYKIVDEAELTIGEIKAKAQRMHKKEGLDVLIIDYLQLISTKGMRNNATRQEHVAEISRVTKILAKELNCVVYVLVQLLRESKDEEKDHIPSKAEIKESGAIAQDSDAVLIIHRPNRDDSDDPKATLVLDKNRRGPADKFISLRAVLEKNIYQDLKASEENSEGHSEQPIDNFPDFGNVSDVVSVTEQEIDDDYFG